MAVTAKRPLVLKRMATTPSGVTEDVTKASIGKEILRDNSFLSFYQCEKNE
jgi:hypothetical protein